jgi:predicted metal-dependent hydrolase
VSDGIDEETLDQGIILFNQQRFFEAHEIWEIAWKKAQGEAKLFLQCLIQIAAALLHAERGNWRGAEALGNKARSKLNGLPPHIAGIQIEDLLAILDQHLAPGSKRKRFATPLLGRQSKEVSA